MNAERLLARFLPAFLKPYWHRTMASPLGYRMAKGAFWSLVGAILVRSLQLVSSVLIARMLGPSAYGELGIIQSTVGMFGGLAGFGLGTTATKYVAEFRGKDPLKAGRILALAELVALGTGGAIALLLYLAAPWLADHALAAPHLSGLLRVSALLLVLGALTGAQAGALAGLEAFRSIATRSVLAGLASFPLMLGGVLLAGVKGAVWGLVGSMAVNWLLYLTALRRETARASVHYVWRGLSKELTILWGFSLPATISGVMLGPVTWVCSAYLVNQPGGYEQMGIFSAANQWRTAVMFIPASVTAVALPLLSSLGEGHERTSYTKVLLYNVGFSAAIGSAAAIAISLLSHPIMNSYGLGSEASESVLTALVASAALAAVNSVIGQALASRSKMWVGMWLNALWSAVLLFCSYQFVRSGLGAVGLAYSYLIAYSVHTVCTGLYCYATMFRYAPLPSQAQ